MSENIIIFLLCYIAVKVWQIDRRLSPKDELPKLTVGAFLGYVIAEHWWEILGVAAMIILFWYLQHH
jgi:hypothetical protein